MPKSEPAPEIVADASPAPGLTAPEEAQRSMIDVMRRVLAAQPKRRVKVRHDSDVFVQINGYSYLIQPNVPVDVPEQVAELLEQGDYI